MNRKSTLLFIFLILIISTLGCKHYSTQTGESNDGYLRFEIDPPTASVFVDDIYVGIAQDFSEKDLRKKEKFLRVSSGHHVIRFELEGFKTLTLPLCPQKMTELAGVLMAT